MLLLGMKSDLRDYPDQSGVHEMTGRRELTTAIVNIVSEQRARQLAEALGEEGFLECSAKQDIDSLHKLFKAIATTSLRYTARNESDHTHGLDCGFYRRSKFAWRCSFSTLVTHVFESTTN